MKLRVLHVHLDEFEGNVEDYSEKQRERFHQDVCPFEERFKGHYDESMIGELLSEKFCVRVN